MPRDVVLHGALLEGTGTQMDKPSLYYGFVPHYQEMREPDAVARKGSHMYGRRGRWTGCPTDGPWSRGVTMARIMAMTTLPLATVRNRLSALVDEVTRTHDTLTITRNGTPAAVVMSVDDYESIMETLALLNDPIDHERLNEAQQAIEAGDVTAGEDVARLVAKRVQRATGAA